MANGADDTDGGAGAHRLARIARGVGFGALLVLGGLLGLVAIAVAVLHTGFGGERLHRFVLPRVNEAIAGHLEVGRLAVHGLGLELRDVELRDPEGSEVAYIARLDAAVAWRGLLRRRIEIAHVELDRPRLNLVQGKAGLNLARAVAARKVEPETPSGPPPRLTIALTRLRVQEGAVMFRDATTGGLPTVELGSLAIDAHGEVHLAPLAYSGDVRLQAKAARPVAGPLALVVNGQGEGAAGAGQLRFDWADTHVALTASSRDARTQEARIERLVVAPALLRAFVPGAPLAADVSVKGRVDRRGDRVETGLAFAAATTTARLDADLDLGRMVANQLHLAAQNVDLSRLYRGGPPSRFDLELQGKGGGRPDTEAGLFGEVELRVPPKGIIDGRPLGPVHVAARAGRGRYAVSALEVALPGVTLTGAGQADDGRLGGKLNLAARDLALTARSLRLPRSLGLAGNGNLALQLGGTLARPSVSGDGRFSSLRGAGQNLAGITLSFAVPDLRRAPAGTQAQLAVARAQLGARTVQDLTLAVTADRQVADRVQVKLATRAPLPLSLDAAARVRRGARTEIALEALALSYPQARWQLAQPATIVVGDNNLVVRGVDLRAAPDQRLAVDLEQSRARLVAKAAIEHLDLGRLPTALLPPELGLGGRVDLAAEVNGPARRPEADVRLAVAGAKVGPLRALDLQLRAQHRRGRLCGQLDARALDANNHVDFDLPAVWPLPAQALVQLRAQLGEVDLAKVGPLVGQKLAGRAKLDLQVAGAARDPAINLKATGAGLQLSGERVDAIDVQLDDPAGKPLVLAVLARVRNLPSRVRLESPVELGRWLTRPPTQDELLAAPFSLKAELEQLPLGALGDAAGAFGPAPPSLPVPPARPARPGPGSYVAGRTAANTPLPTHYSGMVSAQAALTGPISRLRGTVTATATKLTGPRLPPTDATLKARLGEAQGGGLDAHLLVTRRGRNIADLDAALGVGIDDVLAGRSLAPAPVKLKGTVGPLGLQRLVASSEFGLRNPRVLRGLIEARIDIGGTLGQPRADVRMGLRNASLAGSPLGQAALMVGYQDARPRVSLELASADGGKLTFTGEARVDLGLPALQRGIVVNDIPLSGKLQSQSLDLRFLSAIDDSVRAVEGKLDADARLDGVVGAPRIVGRLGWKKGRLVLSDYGELHDIELDLRGDNQQMVLDHLTAKAGNGSAKVTGRVMRRGDDRHLVMEARADLNRFRILTEGQPLGALSLKANATGTVAPEKIDITTQIDEAHLEMEGGNRRDLQSLSRPPDVVVLENGEPVDKKNADRYKALLERQQERQGESTGAAEARKVSAAKTPPPPARAAADVRPVRINVSAPRNLWARGPDVNLEVGLDDGFTINDSDELRIFGTVRVRRGFVEVLGRRFDINQGSTVTFGGPPDRPRLAVDARYKVARAQTETSVAVRVEGTTDALSFTLRSPEHPEYGDTELMSLIATGRLPSEAAGGGSSPSAQAASVLGGLIAEKVQKSLMNRLPIDVLSIQPGDQQVATRLEAGTYIGEDVYVAYVGHIGADAMNPRENRNEVHLEYQLTSRWSFEATYGDARQGSFDLLWTKNY